MKRLTAARRFAILRIAETAPKAELSAATRRKVGIVCGDCYITVKSVVSPFPRPSAVLQPLTDL
ncbi:MAG: hypothetical protein ACLUDM_03980 [[Eubacterium] siraeum]